jgi:hypothetical protein
MGEITVLIRAASEGDERASDRLYERLYNDLRRLARVRLDGDSPCASAEPDRGMVGIVDFPGRIPSARVQRVCGVEVDYRVVSRGAVKNRVDAILVEAWPID